MMLHDRMLLVLGGTGGIGTALIKSLLARGNRIVVATRHPDKLVHRQGVIPVYLDLAAADLDQQLASLSNTYPGIDGVIHCAGQNAFTPLENQSLASLDRLLQVNLRSAMVIARHFVPRFKQAGSGALVFVGSTLGSIGFPGYTTYCASKFGLRGFSEALQRELADTPVQVLYVAPRATCTGMNTDPVTALNRALGNTMDLPDQVARQILEAMENDLKRRFLGWPEKLFVVVNGILPSLVDKSLMKQLPVIRRFLNTEACV